MTIKNTIKIALWGTTILDPVNPVCIHIPVVPHKAVAEVSRIGHYRRD